MSPSFLDRARKSAALLLIGGCGASLLAYLFVVASRISYPFELEWMEGGMVDHVRRLLAGLPVYAKPGIEFVSYLYPPLYYAVASVFARVFGLGFTPLRLLSFLSSLGVFGLLFRTAQRETGSVMTGFVAAGVFAATYDRVGGWFDLARLDSFYLLLLLGGIYTLRWAATEMQATLAGLLIGAAFLTKQSALVVAGPLLVAAFLASPRRAVWFGGAAGLLMGGGAWLLDRVSDGWFRYYCFTLPSRHPRLPGGWLAFWTHDLLPALPIAAVLAAAYVASRVRAGGGRARFFFPLVALGMVGTSWSVRDMVGAEVNNLLPAFAAVSLLAALGLFETGRWADGSPRASRSGVALATVLALVAQIAFLAYDPTTHIPKPADRAAGERLVARLAKIPGEIYAPHHGYLALLAGKTHAYAHTLAMDNVFLDDAGPEKDALGAEILRALSEKRFGAVLLESDGRYGEAILGSYEAREPLFESPDVFWPVTGGRLRPEALCLPKQGPRPGDAPAASEDKTR